MLAGSRCSVSPTVAVVVDVAVIHRSAMVGESAETEIWNLRSMVIL
jgi:hypothetical protein